MKKGVINLFVILVLIIFSIIIINIPFSESFETQALTAVTFNFTDLLPNQTITAMKDVNVTFNVTFDGQDQHNVSLLFYNNTGTTFVTEVNFTSVINGSLGSVYFNSSNYTKGDTIVVELKLWNGTATNAQLFSNISSFINGTDNSYLCGNNETCEYQNLTEAMIGVNDTLDPIYLLENNTRLNFGTQKEMVFTHVNSLFNIPNGYNITLDCNNSYILFTSADCHYFFYVEQSGQNITVTRCNIEAQNNMIDGIKLINTNNVNITKNSFYHIEQGVIYGGNHTNISYNTFNNSYWSIKGGNSLDMNIFGNEFNGNWSNNADFENIYLLGGFEKNLTIRDNNFTNIGKNKAGIHIRANDDDIDNSSIRIINNTFSNLNNVSGIYISNCTGYKEISNNSFYGGVGTGIKGITIAPSKYAYNITIVDNNFTNVYIGIYGLSNSDNLTIDRNKFINSEFGILFNKSSTYLNYSLIYNNSFFNVSNSFNAFSIQIINNTFNETGKQTTGYFSSFSPFTYNNINFSNCILYSDRTAGVLNRVYRNNTVVDSIGYYINGSSNFTRLWLLEDTAGALGCGANANMTAYVEDGYGNDCATTVGGIGGTCHLGIEALALQENGLNNPYTFNTSIINSSLYVIPGYGNPTLKYNYYFFQSGFPINLQTVINSNITGNSFYNINTNMTAIEDYTTSINNLFWYNSFYANGFNQTQNNTGCYNSIGNFYEYTIPYSKMAKGECGLINITSPSGTVQALPSNIQWSAQDSLNSITYYLQYYTTASGWTKIGTTTSTSYTTWSPANGDYILNIISMDNYSNGTYRNITFTQAVPEEPPTESNIPSPGESYNQEQTEKSVLENSLGFTTDINEITNFNLIKNELVIKSINIENPFDRQILVRVYPTDTIKNLVKVEPSEFVVNSHSEQNILLEFFANVEPKVYEGMIMIDSANYGKRIPINVEVIEKNVLFSIDSTTEIKYVKPGEFIPINLKINNQEKERQVAFNVDYNIKNINGEIIKTQTQTVFVKDEQTYQEELEIPSDLKPGKYIIETIVTYFGSSSKSEVEFEVVSEEQQKNSILDYIINFFKLIGNFFL